MKKIFLLLILINFLYQAMGQPGTLDAAFGNNGFQTTGVLKTNRLSEQGRQLLPMPDGSFFVVFEIDGYPTSTTFIARYFSNGNIDSSYGKNGYSAPVGLSGGGQGVLSACAAMQGDKIVLVENALSDKFSIARYNKNGFPDSTFGTNGMVTADFRSYNNNAQSVVIQNDKIIVAGSAFNPTTYYTNFALARYNTDGSPDNTFGINGVVLTEFGGVAFGQSIILQNDKILVAGYAYNLAGFNNDFALARYNADGTLDADFGINGMVTSDFNGRSDVAQSVTLQGDKIVLAGYTEQTDVFGLSHDDFAIARYNFNGMPDSTFDNDGLVTKNFIGSDESRGNSVAFFAGHIIVAGQVVLRDSLGFIHAGFVVAWYNLNGTPDAGYGDNGVVTTDFGGTAAIAQSTAIQNGKLLVAGNTTHPDTYDKDFAVARYGTDGSLDASFNEHGLLTGYYPSGITYFLSAALQGNKIVAAGYTYNATGGTYFALTRYNPDGSPDITFNKNGLVTTGFGGTDNFAQSVTTQDDKIIAAGYASNFGNYYFALARYKTDGSLDSTFGQNGLVTTDFQTYAGGYGNFAQSVVIRDNKILVSGNVYGSFALARYNQNGSLDSTFGVNGLATTDFNGSGGYAQSVALQQDKIVVAGYTYVPEIGGTAFAVARYFGDGSIDAAFGNNGRITTSFNNSFQNNANTVAIQKDKIVVAGVTYNNNTFSNDFALVRYNDNGSPDSTFGNNGLVITGAGVVAQSVVIQGDKIIAGGSPYGPGDPQSEFIIVRYNLNGSIDSTFGTYGVQTAGNAPDAYILKQLLLHGNRLYATGSIEQSGIGTVGAIAAYQLEENATLNCPKDKTVCNDKNVCTAVVNGIDPAITPASPGTAVTYTLSGATICKGRGSASGKTFNKGITTVTYSLTSDVTKSCSFTVTVKDMEAPVISQASASTLLLWPPDHTMRTVKINYALTDNCGAGASLSVTSSEAQSSSTPGDLSPDWKIVDAHHVRLRAESNGFGYSRFFPYFGRIYTIHIKGEDAAGNNTSKKVWVLVPPSWPDNYLGKSEQAEELQVSVMPNPSSSFFTLLFKGGKSTSLSVRVSDELGRVVETKSGINAHGTLTLGENYSTGMYYAEVMQGNKRVIVKLLKFSR